MDTFGFYNASDFRLIASTWLKQQDLTNKSPVEVAKLYYDAISQLQETYQDQVACQNVEQIISHPNIH